MSHSSNSPANALAIRCANEALDQLSKAHASSKLVTSPDHKNDLFLKARLYLDKRVIAAEAEDRLCYGCTAHLVAYSLAAQRSPWNSANGHNPSPLRPAEISPDTHLDLLRLEHAVMLLLSMLPDQHREVIIQRFGIGREGSTSAEEVGANLGFSSDRVLHIEASAIHTLKTPATIIQAYLDIDDFSEALTLRNLTTDISFDIPFDQRPESSIQYGAKALPHEIRGSRQTKDAQIITNEGDLMRLLGLA